MRRFVVTCSTCGATSLANGTYEPDVNATTIEEIDEPCEHLAAGGELSVIDDMNPNQDES